MHERYFYDCMLARVYSHRKGIAPPAQLSLPHCTFPFALPAKAVGMKSMQTASSFLLRLIQTLLNLIKKPTLKAAKYSQSLWLALRALLFITHPRLDKPTTCGRRDDTALCSSSPAKINLPNQSTSTEGLASDSRSRCKLADIVENVLSSGHEGQHQLSLDVNQENIIFTGVDRTNQAYRIERDHVNATIGACFSVFVGLYAKQFRLYCISPCGFEPSG